MFYKSVTSKEINNIWFLKLKNSKPSKKITKKIKEIFTKTNKNRKTF